VQLPIHVPDPPTESDRRFRFLFNPLLSSKIPRPPPHSSPVFVERRTWSSLFQVFPAFATVSYLLNGRKGPFPSPGDRLHQIRHLGSRKLFQNQTNKQIPLSLFQVVYTVKETYCMDFLAGAPTCAFLLYVNFPSKVSQYAVLCFLSYPLGEGRATMPPEMPEYFRRWVS